MGRFLTLFLALSNSAPKLINHFGKDMSLLKRLYIDCVMVGKEIFLLVHK